MAGATIIRDGYFKWTGQDKCRVRSNVTLVQSEDLNILVDCGGARESEEIIKSLKEVELDVKDINILVLTHHHPDHAGGMALFKKSMIVDWASKINGENYEFWKTPSLRVSGDVEILKTPGHTPECASVLVTTEKGIVAIVGDLWHSGDDEKLLVTWNKEALSASRGLIKKRADFIIPGHGKEVAARSAA